MMEEEILNATERWHKGAGQGLELHEYLGWTWEEYKAYVERGEIPQNDQSRPEGRP